MIFDLPGFLNIFAIQAHKLAYLATGLKFWETTERETQK